MSSQPGAGGQDAGASGGQPGTPSGQGGGTGAEDQEFLENVTKLLGILQKMGEMKPKGQDVSKYTKAAADAMEDCIKNVYNQQLGQGNGSASSGDDSSGGGAGASDQTAQSSPGNTPGT